MKEFEGYSCVSVMQASGEEENLEDMDLMEVVLYYCCSENFGSLWVLTIKFGIYQSQPSFGLVSDLQNWYDALLQLAFTEFC